VTYYKLGKLPECQAAFTQAVALYRRSQRVDHAQQLQQGLAEIGLVIV
jgi:hypothetical protein